MTILVLQWSVASTTASSTTAAVISTTATVGRRRVRLRRGAGASAVRSGRVHVQA